MDHETYHTNPTQPPGVAASMLDKLRDARLPLWVVVALVVALALMFVWKQAAVGAAGSAISFL